MRYANLQVLRLFAALGVVWFHLSIYADKPYGVPLGDGPALRVVRLTWFAVPLFFAVSGFVLTQALCARAADGTAGARAGRFLLARFLRLYPGYWLALAIVVVVMRARVYTEYDRWLIYFVNFTEVTLWPAGPGKCPYLLGVEWSLIYEVFLSVALAGLSLLGVRRGLPVAVAVWLGVLTAKVFVRPGYGTDVTPHWSTIALSAYTVPFLLGVLVYYAKDRGRRWRWVVLAAVAVLASESPRLLTTPEGLCFAAGVIGAATVWLAVQFRQVADTNPVARLGDYSYGLFLLHVPLLLAVLHPASRVPALSGRVEVVYAAFAVAVLGGLLFGRVEAKLHARLRPLAKAKFPSLRRLRARLRLRTPVN